eukprot:g11596.t1
MRILLLAAALYASAVALVPLWFHADRRGWLGATDVPPILFSTLTTALVAAATGFAYHGLRGVEPDWAGLAAVVALPVIWLGFLAFFSSAPAVQTSPDLQAEPERPDGPANDNRGGAAAGARRTAA